MILRFSSHVRHPNTYRTPIDDGLSGHAKNRIAGRYLDSPAFHDIVCCSVLIVLYYDLFWMGACCQDGLAPNQ
jgi:hypothetical protein